VRGQKTNARRRGFRGIKTKIERCQILSVSGGKIPPRTVFMRSKLDAPSQRVIFVLPALNPPPRFGLLTKRTQRVMLINL
jgi:hypothetical protein